MPEETEKKKLHSYTAKVVVKPEHDPPEFRKGLGKGTLFEIQLEFLLDKDLSEQRVQACLLEIKKSILDDFIDVVFTENVPPDFPILPMEDRLETE